MLFLSKHQTKRLGRLLLPLLLALVILSLVGFAPVLQGIQQYVTLRGDYIKNSKTVTTSDLSVTDDAAITGDLDVNGATTFDGSVDFDSTVDFSGATVTGVSTSTLSSLTVTGNTVLSGTVSVTSTQTNAGLVNANGGIAVDTSAFTVADATGNTVISGTLAVTGASTLTGDTDVAGTLQYGAANLYPLGYGSVNQQVVCGTTETFTGTLEVTPTGLTTVTYVLPAQITQPAATAASWTVSDPVTSTFTLYSWGADYNAGTTGIAMHYCALGDQ